MRLRRTPCGSAKTISRVDDSYAKCMTIAQYPQQLDDKFIATLLQQVPYIVLSIAIQPVETEDAYREIEDSRMKTDAEKGAV